MMKKNPRCKKQEKEKAKKNNEKRIALFFLKSICRKETNTNTIPQKRKKRNIIRLKGSKERFRAELLWCVLLCLCTSSSSSVKRSVYYCSVTSVYYDIGLNAFVICLYLYIAPEKECRYDYDDERT